MDEIDKAVLLINLLADKEGCRLRSNHANECTGKREKGWWLGRDGINGNS